MDQQPATAFPAGANLHGRAEALRDILFETRKIAVRPFRGARRLRALQRMDEGLGFTHREPLGGNPVGELDLACPVDGQQGAGVAHLEHALLDHRLNWLRKLPGFQPTPHGLEWRLLRLMPSVCLAGTLAPALLSVAARFFITGRSAAELARQIQLFDFVMIGLVIFIWTLVITVTIGCVIVWLMKGPAYVADGFEVSHSDAPGR